jgi:glycosyltransferase involved in cell wall biosynthesis
MIKDLYHYILISRSGIFDPNYYLKQYPDVRAADVNPLWHFIRIGWKEERNPTSYFDTKFYLENNPDVDRIQINPLIHYIKHGIKEGRKPRPDYEIVSPLQSSIITSESNTENIKNFDVRVSVIIPTKNAGSEFEFLLKMLKIQIGVIETEIVVVDSGSQDNTLRIADEYGAKIISILPEQFSHSYARNLGAKAASGDYLLFTVQDALPPTKTWIYELMSVLDKEGVSAVSCAETPREDADLFYRVMSWNHYNFLGVNKLDKILKMPETPSLISLRQNGQLSDLACLIPRDLFLNYQHRLDYAEDLDLGIRLIKDGHKIAFLGSTRIIHSHNRPPFYFLKRGYVDSLFLSYIFSDFIIPQVKVKELSPAIIFTHNFLYQEVFGRLEEIEFPCKTEEIITSIEQALQENDGFKSSSTIIELENEYLDHQAVNFIKELTNNSSHAKINAKHGELLLQPLMGYLQITFNYLRNTYEFIDKPIVDEIKSCLFKEYSILIGAYLAYCFLNSSKDEKWSLSTVHTLLADGI